MRKITKRQEYEPRELTDWKRKNPNKRYSQLKDPSVRQAIRAEALLEQYFLCGHCCQALLNDDCHNEHIEAQDINQNKTLDFSNIIVSCNTFNQCGKAHKSQALPLTPFMDACETDLEFKLSGRVSGKTLDATKTIEVLNLGDSEKNNKSLIEKRKRFIESALLVNGVDPKDGLDDDELIQLVIDDILKPKSDRLEAFSPVVVNVLKQWIA